MSPIKITAPFPCSAQTSVPEILQSLFRNTSFIWQSPTSVAWENLLEALRKTTMPNAHPEGLGGAELVWRLPAGKSSPQMVPVHGQG